MTSTIFATWGTVEVFTPYRGLYPKSFAARRFSNTVIEKPKAIVVIERATGRPIGPPVAIKPSEFFCRLPRLEQRVWRYMEYWKFEKLVREKSLYFRRSDKLEDDMEGTYAEANRNFTTKVWQDFCAAYPVKHDPSAQAQGAMSFRHAVFINCWHMNKVESREMWRKFGKATVHRTRHDSPQTVEGN